MIFWQLALPVRRAKTARFLATVAFGPEKDFRAEVFDGNLRIGLFGFANFFYFSDLLCDLKERIFIFYNAYIFAKKLSTLKNGRFCDRLYPCRRSGEADSAISQILSDVQVRPLSFNFCLGKKLDKEF